MNHPKGALTATTRLSNQGLRHCASISSMPGDRTSVSSKRSPGGSPHKKSIGSHVAQSDPPSPSKRLTRSGPPTPKQRISQKTQSNKSSGKAIKKLSSQVINCDNATSAKAHPSNTSSAMLTDLDSESEMCLEVTTSMDSNQNSIQQLTASIVNYNDKEETIIINKMDGLEPLSNLSAFDTIINSKSPPSDANTEKATNFDNMCPTSPCSLVLAKFAMSSASILYNNTIKVCLNGHNDDTLTTKGGSVSYNDLEEKMNSGQNSMTISNNNTQTVLTQQATNAKTSYFQPLSNNSSNTVVVCPKASPEDCESPPVSKRASCDHGKAVLMVSAEESWMPFSKTLNRSVRTQIVSTSSPLSSPNPVRKKRCNII